MNEKVDLLKFVHIVYNSEMTPYRGLQYVNATNIYIFLIRHEYEQGDPVCNGVQKLKLLHTSEN